MLSKEMLLLFFNGQTFPDRVKFHNNGSRPVSDPLARGTAVVQIRCTVVKQMLESRRSDSVKTGENRLSE